MDAPAFRSQDIEGPIKLCSLISVVVNVPVRGDMGPFVYMFYTNCPINERTGDGILVGRCWFSLKNNKCPRHGDVSKAVEKYKIDGTLTNEVL